MHTDFKIHSTNLSLQLPRRDDAAELAQLVCHSPSLYPWFDWANLNFSVSQAHDFILANHLQWIKGVSFGFGVYHQCDKKMIGMVALNELSPVYNSASIGYWIADAFQGQGKGKEAFLALCHFCFNTLKLTRIEVYSDPNNHISRKFILSCGATHEGLARNRYLYDGIACDGEVFSLLPEDMLALSQT
ncbi:MULTISPECIES: GNAT family N-acetyltransferase [unclassified Vibrio]|uniref:GNAT family protein n=1 Tax=Vibrio sp. HB236076 TaxID=3232307 RepID=A0AB39HJQ9_9VIBR|nr:GNAT family protein [Vibrio sp. HB161653]MDP5255116.1 GNAT family protein [Vibrio sp. HB161653]